MLHLTGWQVLSLVVSAAAAIFLGKLLGSWIHRALYRLTLLTRTPADEGFVLRLAAPVAALCGVVVWDLAICLFALPFDVLEACRGLGRAGLLVALAWAAMRMIDSGVERFAVRSTWITGHRVAEALLPTARKLVKVMIATIAGIMVLATLGYEVGVLVAGFAIAALAVGLAAQKPLENVCGAYAIGVDHPCREGDYVKLETGVTGRVEEIGWRSTRIRTADRTLVTVPNRKLADTEIETLTEHDRMRFHARMRLAVGTTAAQLERLLGELTQLLLGQRGRGPEQPAVHLVAVAEGSIELELVAWFECPTWQAFEAVRDRLLIQSLDVIAATGIALHGAPNPAIGVAAATRTSHPRSAGELS